MKISQYPQDFDSRPLDLNVGVLTDASGNGGAQAPRVYSPDNSPIDSFGLILLDKNGNLPPFLNDSAFYPEAYGAKADGVTDDGAAFAALSVALNANGGGRVVLKGGATYIVGGNQVLNPNPHTATGYAFPPAFAAPLDFQNCVRGVVVEGNGARIRCVNGAKYGTFNDDGTPYPSVTPYTAGRAAAPYFYMIRAEGCSAVHIANVELDGNKQNISLGGPYGDSGWQIGCTGIFLHNNTGPETVINVNSHHHCQDGITVDGPATVFTAANENLVMIACNFNNNARQGLSLVGGKGVSAYGCNFNWTGKDTANSDVIATLHSAPGAGVDFEAEGGKYIGSATFNNCEFIGNWGNSFVAFQQAMDNVKFRGCKFVGTTNSAISCSSTGFEFEGCTVVGYVITLNYVGDSIGAGPAFPAECFRRCIFTNSLAKSPTGALYNPGTPILIDTFGMGAHVGFTDCRFEHAQAGTIGVGSPDIIIMRDCKFDVTGGGTLNPSGRFFGRTIFTETNGTIGATPLGGVAGPFAGKIFSGHAESAWEFRTGGNSVLYPATITSSSVPKGRNQFGDASYTITVNDNTRPEIIHFNLGALTADRTLTLSTVGAVLGSRYRIIRGAGATGVGKLDIGPGLVKLVAASSWAEVEYNGSAWMVIGAGSLNESIVGDWDTNGFYLGNNSRAFRFLDTGGTIYMQVGPVGGGSTPFVIGGHLGTTMTSLTINSTASTFSGTVAASNLSGTNTGDQFTSIAQNTVIGRTAAGSGPASALTTIPAAVFPAFTGDVTTSAGAVATTIAANVVTYAKFQQPAASKLVGNPTGSAANAQDIGLAGGLGFSGTNLTINGAINAAASIAIAGAITSSGANIGYATGAGGTVAQATSKTTAVTLNKLCGTVTLQATSIAADATASFTFNNSFIAAGGRFIWNHESVGTFGAYNLNSHGHGAGVCTVDVHNLTPAALAEAIVIGFTYVASTTA